MNKYCVDTTLCPFRIIDGSAVVGCSCTNECIYQRPQRSEYVQPHVQPCVQQYPIKWDYYPNREYSTQYGPGADNYGRDPINYKGGLDQNA